MAKGTKFRARGGDTYERCDQGKRNYTPPSSTTNPEPLQQLLGGFGLTPTQQAAAQTAAYSDSIQSEYPSEYQSE